MLTSENIRQVGVLQDFGVPFSSLYVDMKNRLLYIFVRMPSPKSCIAEFAVTGVSPQEVEAYMNDDIGLNDIFNNKDSYIVQLSGSDTSIRTIEHKGVMDFNESMNRFDSDFCDDDIWLETFLDRLKNNKSLEILIGESIKEFAI